MHEAVNESPEQPEPEYLVTESDPMYSMRIAVAGVLGALSIALGATAAFLPRIPGWGIALFDPVSIIWIIAFLIGGIEVGMITSLAGFGGLFLFDPTGVGPIFKLLATLPMIIVPWAAMRFSNQQMDGARLGSLSLFSKYIVVAYILRLSIMIPLNLLMVPMLFGISDVSFIVMYTLILNTIQSFWDAVIPFYIVHRTGLFDSFRMW